MKLWVAILLFLLLTASLVLVIDQVVNKYISKDFVAASYILLFSLIIYSVLIVYFGRLILRRGLQ